MLPERGGGGPWRPETGEGTARAHRGETGTSGNAERPSLPPQPRRGHHEGSGKLRGKDSRRETSARGDGQMTTAKEENRQQEVVGLC